jgi:hypothetical protein
MAASNMIVTLAMNATKYASGLRKAGADTSKFGSFTTKAFNLAKGAMLGLTLAVIRYVPILLSMGAESRKADIQLNFMLETMNGVSAATTATTKRMAAYADQVNKATGIDDEQIKAVQRKLLVFKSLRKTADEMGGTFDRTTQAAIDLAAGGFGTMETNAVKLGRVLENPTANLNALSRAGITFTEAEKRKITVLQESGKLFEAQNMVLKSVENRVLGLAEASATPLEKLNAQFAQIGDSIGEAMLPAIEDMNKEVSKWLSTPQGKKDIEAITEAFIAGAYAVRDFSRFLADVFRTISDLKKLLDAGASTNAGGRGDGITPPNRGGGSYDDPTGLGGLGGGRNRGRTVAPIVVNFNAPVDSVSAGREVARVLADYSRANGVR